MSEEDKKILNNLINKKEEILEFKEIKAIVKLLLEIHSKIKKKTRKSRMKKLIKTAQANTTKELQKNNRHVKC